MELGVEPETIRKEPLFKDLFSEKMLQSIFNQKVKKLKDFSPFEIQKNIDNFLQKKQPIEALLLYNIYTSKQAGILEDTYFNVCAEIQNHFIAEAQKNKGNLTEITNICQYLKISVDDKTYVTITQKIAIIHIEEGIKFCQEKKYIQAEAFFNLAIDITPNYWQAYDERAKCYQEQGKVELYNKDMQMAETLQNEN